MDFETKMLRNKPSTSIVLRVKKSAMNSLGKSCNELKAQYDDCFKSWFSHKFLKGETNDVCEPLFQLYQQCFKEEYDACFNQWFSEKFLKGDHNDAMCSELLRVYKNCVEKAIKEHHLDLKELQTDVLGTDKEHKAPPKT